MTSRYDILEIVSRLGRVTVEIAAGPGELRKDSRGENGHLIQIVMMA